MKTSLHKNMKTLFTLGTLIIMAMILPQHNTYAQKNVGINNASPDASAALDVKSGTGINQGILIPFVDLSTATFPSPGPATHLFVVNTSSTFGRGIGLYRNSGTAGTPAWKKLLEDGDAWNTTGNSGTTASTSAIGVAANNNFIGTTSNVDFPFVTNGFERMRLFNSGQLSIGSLSSGAKLDIHQTTSTPTLRLYNYGNPNEMEFRRSSGTQAAQTATGAGSIIGRMLAVGFDGSTYNNRTIAGISFETETATTSTNSSGRIVFTTTTTGSTSGTGGTERMRIDNAGNVGIANNNPDDKLDVNGSAQILNYLKVGNPTAPPTQTLNDIKIYDLVPDAGFGGVNYTNACGTNVWGLIVGGAAKNYFVYTGTITATPSLSRLLTSWMWIPNGSSALYVDLEWAIITADNTWDGMYFEYTTDGTTFTKLTPLTGAYSTAAFNGGANPAGCAAPNPTGAHWGLVNTAGRSEFIPAGLAGKWVRFSIAATNDLANPVGEMRIYGLSVDCTAPSGLLNGSFQNGSIYAQNNVYAGSNVLMGDVAEYFKLKDVAQPGMLVSLNTDAKNQYELTKMKNDAKVIGIVSTAPTVTINNPNGGTPVALTGRVPICVTNENGEIHIGDYLTASSKPGYAMKATGNCYVVGKAIESLSGNSGKILCIIDNGWMNTSGNNDNLASGEFFLPKGQTKISVKDPLSSKKSKVFLSLLDKSSGYHLSKKDDGFFEIEFDSSAEKDIHFDYFIMNSLSSRKIEEIKTTESKFEEVKLPVAQATEKDLKAPPIPSDPSKFWKWNGETLEQFIPSTSSEKQ